ncbi:MAG: hypothetical protein RI884_3172 [Pseudomonadota bacterium]|jgi:hypothetical protein
MTSPVTPPAAIQPGVTLRHYKGGVYRVVGLCRIEATLKTGVLYQACQGDEDVVWMRPLAEFSDLVTTPEGLVPRFAVVAR